MKEYVEPEKAKVRSEAITSAIITLTTKRFRATLTPATYVRDVHAHLLQHGTEYDKKIASILSEKEVLQWENFYRSIVGKRKASDLKVAYLSGPNPENDLEVLVENGILPENVWAFESDNKTYDRAVVSALESKYPFIKIYKGRIENYLKVLPAKFDIIYLDFCSTIASEKTLSVIREIFLLQKLNSPGVIITNFAFPDKERDEQTWRRITTLAANYLFPKQFTEDRTGKGGGAIESANAYGLTEKAFLKLATKNDENFYGQFITRILYDLPSVLIPYQRFAGNLNLQRIFFQNFELSRITNDETIEDKILFPTDHPIYWGLNSYISQEESFVRLLSSVTNQLAINSQGPKLIEAIELMDYFLGEGTDSSFYSPQLAKIESNWKAFEKYIFCDVFLFHQLKDILVGQLTSPYYYNVEMTKRWTYKAKSTRMFMDLITYDECRYVFDWMPTIDMMEEGVEDWNRQLTLRFAMDGIAKNRRWYNNEFFSGTAVIDQFTKGFRARQLKPRKRIN